MRDVVSNTSPFVYLHQLRKLELLPQLYSAVRVPSAVDRELLEGSARGYDVPTLSTLSWVRIERVANEHVLRIAADLGPGEREAIALAAQSRPHSLLILDDGLARRFAKLLGIPLTGTLGVLLKAKQVGVLEKVRPLLDQLGALGFRVSPTTRAAVLELAGELERAP